MTLTLVIGTKILCMTHFLTLADLPVKFDKINSVFLSFVDTSFVKEKTYALNLGNGNQSFVQEHHLTLFYLSLKFDFICLAPIELL